MVALYRYINHNEHFRQDYEPFWKIPSRHFLAPVHIRLLDRYGNMEHQTWYFYSDSIKELWKMVSTIARMNRRNPLFISATVSIIDTYCKPSKHYTRIGFI